MGMSKSTADCTRVGISPFRVVDMRRMTRVPVQKRGVRGETEKLSLEPTTVGRIMLRTLLTLLAVGVSLAFAVGGEGEFYS